MQFVLRSSICKGNMSQEDRPKKRSWTLWSSVVHYFLCRTLAGLLFINVKGETGKIKKLTALIYFPRKAIESIFKTVIQSQMTPSLLHLWRTLSLLMSLPRYALMTDKNIIYFTEKHSNKLFV